MCGGMQKLNPKLPFSNNSAKSTKETSFQILHNEMSQNFQMNGSDFVIDFPRSGRPSVSEEVVDNMQTVFQRSFSIS